MVFAGLLLAACGAPTDDGDVDAPVGGGDDTITAPPAAAPTLMNIEGEILSIASARYVPSGSTILPGQMIRLDAGWLSGTLNGEIQIDGNPVTITNGLGTLGADTVAVTYEPGRAGDHAGAMDVVVFDTSGDLISENTFVFGVLTEDSVLAARDSGSLTYTGSFQANGIQNGASDIEYAGTMTLSANFSTDQVTGSLDGMLNGAADVAMELETGSFSENSFAGDLACTGGCTGSGAYSGAFYGPDVQEVGGVLTFEFVAGTPFVGAGTFILDNPS